MTIVPLLIFVQLLFLPLLAWNARRGGHLSTTQLAATLLPVAGLVAWTLITATLGAWGVYQSPDFYQLYPALWLPVIPIALVLASLAIPSVRTGITSSLVEASLIWVTS